MSDRYYIRFGEIPEDERSGIRYHGILVGHEIGVSAYHGVEIDGVWHVVYPNPSSVNTMDDLTHFVGGSDSSVSSDFPVYLITGDRVGTGCDGEPLLKNVRIIKQLTGQFVYTNTDIARKLSETIKR